MSFGTPEYAIALVLVIALAVLAVRQRTVHRNALARVFTGQLLARVLPPHTDRRRAWSLALQVVGLLFVGLALLEPRYGKEVRKLDARGVDLVLAVDLSRSMDATDVEPSRMERARREIMDLIGLLEGDRVGMVIYAAGAYQRLPLTRDYKALELVVRELETSTFQAQGSRLGPAIDASLELLDRAPGQAGKAILVVTDGEDHEPETALAAARSAAGAGASIFGLVVGQCAANIPLPNGSLVRDGAGNVVTTTPSTTLLTDMARLTGGAVVQSVVSADDVQQLYASEIRRTVTAAKTSSIEREVWKLAYQAPLGFGIGALLLGFWLGDGRRSAAMATMLALLIAPAAWGQESLVSGDEAYRAGRYEEAVQIFEQLAGEQPGNPDILERLGAARYRAGDYPGAARAFDRQRDLTNDPDAVFNSGNANFRSGRFDEALAAYEAVLKNQPDHLGAQRNRELLMKELQQHQAEQQQRQQQQNEQQQQGEQQQGEQQQGEQQQGEQQGEQQQGEQQGEQQQGEQQGEQQQGQQQQGQQQQGQQQQPSESDAQDGDGTRQDEPTTGEGVRPEDLEENAPETSMVPGGEDGTPSEVSTDPDVRAAEAALDQVEEGRPRAVVPGKRTKKPW